MSFYSQYLYNIEISSKVLHQYIRYSRTSTIHFNHDAYGANSNDEVIDDSKGPMMESKSLILEKMSSTLER